MLNVSSKLWNGKKSWNSSFIYEMQFFWATKWNVFYWLSLNPSIHYIRPQRVTERATDTKYRLQWFSFSPGICLASISRIQTTTYWQKLNKLSFIRQNWLDILQILHSWNDILSAQSFFIEKLWIKSSFNQTIDRPMISSDHLLVSLSSPL